MSVRFLKRFVHRFSRPNIPYWVKHYRGADLLILQSVDVFGKQKSEKAVLYELQAWHDVDQNVGGLKRISYICTPGVHHVHKCSITNSSFAAGCMRNLLPGFAPISLHWFSLYVSFSNICKATTVTHTSESIAIYCVKKLVSCVTHLQSCAKVDIWNKKKKLRTVAKIKTQDYKIWAQL